MRGAGNGRNRAGKVAALLVAAAAAAASLLLFGETVRAADPTSPAVQTPDPDSESRKNAEELNRLKRAAEEKRRLARELRGKEKGVLGRLRKADEALNATQRYIGQLASNEIRIQNEINTRELLLDDATRELDRRRMRLIGWMREAYKKGRARGLEVMFSAASFSDLLKRSYFLSAVMQQERRLLSSVKDQKRVVENEKLELENRRSQIVAVRGEKENESRRYQNLKETQKVEVSKIRSQRKSYEQAARELDAAAKRLQKVMADLEERRKRRLREGTDPLAQELDRNNFGANRGRLPWPATGQIIGRFGLETHPEWGTQVRNNGIDIKAPEGSAVRSVGDGRVEVSDWLPGYGQSVIVNHGQGFYSIYAHLGSASVTTGTRVAAGQTLGTVGDSGSLKGPCLHFEMRRGREAQNPESWLR
jgi:septal ring factor EnvC (AmiA/AmiB activator)